MNDHREHAYIPKLKEAFAEGKIERREFLRYATLLGMSASAAYAFVGKVTGESFVPRARAAAMPKGGTVRVSERVQELKTPHAYNWGSPAVIATHVVQQLTRTGQDNITRPLLCESWEASDDLRTWTFRLRKVNWHNGRPFTADDVLWNFKHILDPETGSSSIGLMKEYMLTEVTKEDGSKTHKIWDANAIEKIDDHTVRLNLKVPQVAIPEHLFHYTNAMIDPEEGGIFGPGSNGTGPFELVSAEVGRKAVLKARKDYYGDGPYIDAIEFVDLGDDPSAKLAALASRQIHGVPSIDTIGLAAVEKLPHVQVLKSHTAGTAVVQLMIDKKPFDDPRVGQALRYGMDAGTVVQVAVRGYGLKGEHHFVAPIHPEYAKLPEMKRDPAKARKLLADAGYPDGIDIEFFCKKDPAWELLAVQNLVEQWKDANIRAKIRVLPSAQFWEIWDKEKCAFVAWGHRPLGTMVLALGFRSGVPWNPTGFADKEFDELLTQAEGTLDVEERRKIMAKIEKIMQERGPIAQPVWTDVIAAFDKRVKGYRPHPFGFVFGEELGIET